MTDFEVWQAYRKAEERLSHRSVSMSDAAAELASDPKIAFFRFEEVEAATLRLEQRGLLKSLAGYKYIYRLADVLTELAVFGDDR